MKLFTSREIKNGLQQVRQLLPGIPVDFTGMEIGENL
jgi:hypothetical protein